VIPLKGKTAEEISQRLIDQVFLKVGPPMRLLSDNAKEFHSVLLRRLSDTFGYKRIFIQTYRPQQNGANERSHAELFRWLKMYMYEAETTKFWPTFKDLLAYTYNTTPHSTLGGKTPFEIIFGKKPPLKPFGWPEHSKPSNADFKKFLGLRDEELQALRLETRKVIEYNMKTSLDRANRKLKVPEFVLGDEVLELEQRIVPRMVTPKRDWGPTYQPRPMIITEVISDAHVRVREGNGEERVLHVDRLKRFNRRDDCIGFSNLPPRPLQDEDRYDLDEDVRIARAIQDPEIREGIERVLPLPNTAKTSHEAEVQKLIEDARQDRTRLNLGPRVIPEQLKEPRAASGLANLVRKRKEAVNEWLNTRSLRNITPRHTDPSYVSHGRPTNIFSSREGKTPTDTRHPEMRD
jgi:hypothetical protein